MNSQRCLKCGKIYTPKRKTSKFCSTSCRVGYSQRGNQIDIDIRNAQSALERVQSIANDHPEMVRKQSIKALIELHKFVSSVGADMKRALDSEVK